MPPKKKASERGGHGQQELRGPREKGRRRSPDNPRLLRFVRISQVPLPRQQISKCLARPSRNLSHPNVTIFRGHWEDKKQVHVYEFHRILLSNVQQSLKTEIISSAYIDLALLLDNTPLHEDAEKNNCVSMKRGN